MAEGAVGRASFRDVFGVSEFRALWVAQMLSVAGDQLARVALTVLVYDRTRSAALAALTFVMGVMPIFFGGAVLSGLGDRLPRRMVMIGCDLARAALVLVMTVPGVPLWILVVLLFVVTAGNAPFNAARAAIYPEILAGDRYVVGTALTLTTFQFAQVIGFAAGGAVVGFFGVRTSLVADAATFVASALLVRFGVAARPAANRRPAEARPEDTGPEGTGPQDTGAEDTGPESTESQGTGAAPASGWMAGLRLVFGNPALRTPMLFGWLAALYNAPEGAAAPYARSLGGGAVTTGLLLATPALGYTFSALVYGRMVEPAHRARLMGPLATGCSVFLIPIAARPPLPVTLVLFALSGACACFQVAANSAFVAAAPYTQRSQAFGLATAGMSLGQGVAMVAAGAAAQHFAPAIVIAAAGTLGTAAALGLGVTRPARS